MASLVPGMQKNLIHDFGKLSFQTLKFVTNIKADNSIMCLWFQTEYGQQKHLTAYGELCDLCNSPYLVGFFFVHSHIMQFETINTYLGLLFKQS